LMSLFAFMCMQVPAQYSHWLLSYAALLLLASRLPQIHSNFKRRHTGVLSLSTLSMQISIMAMRLVIVVFETKDMARASMTLMMMSLNIVIFVQVVMYKTETKRILAGLKGKPKAI